LNESQIELDSAAEQIIENQMNSYMDDVIDKEKYEGDGDALDY